MNLRAVRSLRMCEWAGFKVGPGGAQGSGHQEQTPLTTAALHNVQIGAINPYFPFRVHQSPEDGRTETQTSDQIAQHYVSGIGQGFWSMATNLAASQGLFRCSPVNGLRLVQVLTHDAL